jgi:hypothetical protein
VGKYTTNDDIEMVEEKVTIFPKGYTRFDGKDRPYRYEIGEVPKGGGPGGGPVFQIEAEFLFKNHTDRTLDIDLGFPESPMRIGSDDRGDEDSGWIYLPLSNLRAWVSGREVDVQELGAPGPGAPTWWTLPARFEPQEAVRVKVLYDQEMYKDVSISGSGYFLVYELWTGAAWKGVIGRADIQVFNGSKTGYSTLLDIEPTHEDNIIVGLKRTGDFMPHTIASSSLPSDRTYFYNPFSARDGNLSTAWVEGVAGPGEGEWIVLKCMAPEVDGLRIGNGYQSAERDFFRNARVKRARIYFMNESEGQDLFLDKEYSVDPQEITAAIDLIENAVDQQIQKTSYGRPTVESVEIDLSDNMGIQDIDFGRSVPCDYIAFQILEVYPGTHYEDTCIAELELLPLPPLADLEIHLPVEEVTR